jgi:patatin-like phospholipase/acyl hydrolase
MVNRQATTNGVHTQVEVPPAYSNVPPPMPEGGFRLLSCDGGGCKGVSSVMILSAIMERVQKVEEARGIIDKNPRKPSDYFQMAAGTSTGGLIALMLFRLQMNTEQCLKAYHDLASKIFAPQLLGLPLLGRWFKTPAFFLNVLFTGAMFGKKNLEGAMVSCTGGVLSTFRR